MGGYIRVDKDTPDDPRLLALADQLMEHLAVTLRPGTTIADAFSSTDARLLLCSAMLGGLVTLWSYGDTHIQTGDILPLTRGGLAQVMRLPAWAVTLFPRDWIDYEPVTGRVILPNFIEKNALNPRDIRKKDKVLQRKQWAERKRRERERKKKKSRRDTPRDTSRGHGPVTRTPVPVPGPVPSNPNTGTVTNGAAARERPGGPAPPRENGAEAPEVTAQRQKLRGVVAGLRTAKKVPTS